MSDAAALKLLVLVHAAATLLMVGVMLMIHVVHYPLFREVGAASYPAYERAHINAITVLVLPLMLAELVTGVMLLAAPPPGVPAWSVWLGMALMVFVWAITGLVNAPQHVALAAGFDPAIHAALLASNAVRTLAWIARGGLVLWWLWALLKVNAV